MNDPAKGDCCAIISDSINASVPSKIALATSVTSARVGRGFHTIERNIWVAVMTGLPRRLALLMIIFCTPGIRS